jgi:hypothetical protein
MRIRPITMLRTTLARTLATIALTCVAGGATLGHGPAAHAAGPKVSHGPAAHAAGLMGRSATMALGGVIGTPCRRCIAPLPPKLLVTHYDWDGYQEVDVFGHNFTPNRWMEFVITDHVTGEQVATALGWSGENGYLTSYPGSGIPPENGAAIFNLPLDGCGGYGSDGLDIQAYDPVANLWSNVLYYNAACL